MGLIVAAMGLFIVLMSVGVIPADEASFHAPRWIISLAGMTFLLGGGLVGLSGFEDDGSSGLSTRMTILRFFRTGAALTLVLLLVIVSNWVAFGPGERSGSITSSLPFISVTKESGDFMGRVCFGFGAILFDGILLIVLVSNVARWWRGRIEDG